MRIFGIDPGSLHTGFGVIDVAAQSIVAVDAGVIAPPAGVDLCGRLTAISGQLAERLAAAAPDLVAIENIFTARSQRSALVLGQARGAALVAVGSLRVPVVEIAPTRVKSLVAGHGRASKAAVARAVKDLLKIRSKLAPDASDALAIALSAAFHIPPPGATLPRLKVRRVRARKAWDDEIVRRLRKSDP